MRRFFSYTWLLPLVLFQACSPTVKVPSKKAITNQDLPLPSVTISLSSKLLNLDPVKPAPQSDIITIYLTAGRLFKLNRDWSVEPELAESMKVSEDGLEAKVILKEDIVYSDGTKLTSQDVVFAYTRNRDFPGPFFPGFWPLSPCWRASWRSSFCRSSDTRRWRRRRWRFRPIILAPRRTPCPILWFRSSNKR